MDLVIFLEYKLKLITPKLNRVQQEWSLSVELAIRSYKKYVTPKHHRKLGMNLWLTAPKKATLFN